MRRLTRDTLADFVQPQRETIAFPLLGMEVVVTELNQQAVEMAGATVAALGDTPEGNRQTELLFASYAIVDDDGERPFFSDDGRAELAKLPELAIKRVAMAAMKLSGMGEVAKKN